ncbi:ISC system 2Fe-2S type ferredoxin [Massilia arenosa]|uniref:2Fe-2S ferredoxin n=1 Tax=Zemynaea arenosa TaxID=2561931 RepID=A0A4Y9SAJ6_9BURK|nr:ISC system 2Fe-2S type ferredoxin [Massilia arenosa]TFW19074.1 ISC system 2Fe-2S type ferredoxin [Massilia arenosa]
MTHVTVKPHPESAPEGADFEVASAPSLCDALLDAGVDIEHACGKVGACTTCHVIIEEGFDSLNEATDQEEDMLDRAWGVTPHSRLSCQVKLGDQDLVVSLPQYTINQVREKG